MGSNNDQSDHEYELDLTPPDVEQSTVIIKKQTPPAARQNKIFNRLETLEFVLMRRLKYILRKID